MEYVLLMAVVSSLVFTVTKSEQFQALFGKDGKFGSEFRKEVEYSYRHARGGRELYIEHNYQGRHDSYNGRFFSAKDAYPK